jgi:SAM-dependent methyltransferase
LTTTSLLATYSPHSLASGASNDAIATSSFALLDAGCGAELAVLRAAMPDLSKLQIPARVLCVDGLSSAEQRAREKMAEIVGEHETTSQSGNVEASMLCADLCALGAALGAKRFNVVSCFGVLFHIPRSLHRQVLLDLYRALQPGGELVLGLASEAMDDTPLTTCNGTPPTTSPTTSNGTISSSSSESEQATSPTLKCSQFHPDAYVALMEECEFEIRERSGVPMSQVTDATRQVLPKEIGLEVWSVYKPEL